MQLPQRLGGLQIDLAGRLAPLARAARLMEGGPRVREAVRGWAAEEGVQLIPEAFDSVAEEQEELLQALAIRGIPALVGTGEPGSNMAEDPLRPRAPPRHLLSALLQASAAESSRQLYAQADAKDKVRLLSAGGPTAGSSLVAQLSGEGLHFSDRQWSAALRWRLGVPAPPPASACRNADAQEDLCGAELDPDGDHAVDCPRGPLRNFRHDDLADHYADFCEQAGGVARREAIVPEFSGTKEAWLDVWSHGIPELPDLLLDVTVRHPRASRYRPGSERQAGACAAKAEVEKHERYPAAGGRVVWPAAHETWGRLGMQAETLLQTLAAAAARRAYRRGRVGGNDLRRWRAQLDATLQRSVAAQLISAHLGLPGRSRKRRSPLDVERVECSCLLAPA